MEEPHIVFMSPPKIQGGEVISNKAASVHFSEGLLSPKEKEYLSS
jgi:hypothetical protein